MVLSERDLLHSSRFLPCQDMESRRKVRSSTVSAGFWFKGVPGKVLGLCREKSGLRCRHVVLNGYLVPRGPSSLRLVQGGKGRQSGGGYLLPKRLRQGFKGHAPRFGHNYGDVHLGAGDGGV